MAASVPQLRRLSDLSPADRQTALAKLRAVPHIAAQEGFEPWEFVEQVSAEGRALGISLTTQESERLARTA